jgi:hypothetical protein
MAVLAALVVLVVAVVVGIWLMTSSHLIIGLAVFFGSIPFALAAWMLVNDRREA